ncbi:MAG: gliding motility-associated C-terminal domain-containing protein [Bacteroidota bacterium]
MKFLRYIYLLFFYFLIEIFYSQNISFFPDTIYTCKSDSVRLSIPKDILSKSVNIQWITPYSIIYHSSEISVFNEGKYILKLKTKQSEILDSVVIVKSDVPKIELNDTIICSGKSIILPLKHPQYQFYLNDNKNPVQQLLINHSGKYTIKVSNRGCMISKQFEVKNIFPTIPEHDEYVFCISDENKKISVKHNGISSILWSNGSTQKSINVDKEGEYWVKISDKYCGTKTDTINVKFKPCNCEVVIPNAFSPNEDGKNDFFAPVLSCEYSYYNLTIYDKWNNVVFSTNNPNARWDGKYKGNPLPEDVYVYKLETIEKNSDKKNSRTGKIALIR